MVAMYLRFERWLTISRRVARTYRVAVWRRIACRAKRLGGAPRAAPLWSAAERAAIERETGRVG